MPEVAFMIRRIFPRRALDVHLVVERGSPTCGWPGSREYQSSARHEQAQLDPEEDDRGNDQPAVTARRRSTGVATAAPAEPDAAGQRYEGGGTVEQVEHVGGSGAAGEKVRPRDPVHRDKPDDEQHEAVDREPVIDSAIRASTRNHRPQAGQEDGDRRGDDDAGQELVGICHVRTRVA